MTDIVEQTSDLANHSVEDLKSCDFIVKLIKYVNNYVPENLPEDLRSKLQIFYMNRVRKSLDEAYAEYGNFPVKFHKAKDEEELFEEYPDYNDDTVDEAVRMITKDLVPPAAWGFDYVNCDGPAEQSGFWEMYEAYEQGQF